MCMCGKSKAKSATPSNSKLMYTVTMPDGSTTTFTSAVKASTFASRNGGSLQRSWKANDDADAAGGAATPHPRHQDTLV